MLSPFPSQPSEPGEEPVIRIANTILAYAIQDGVHEIQIVPRPKAVVILYRSPQSEEWKVQMEVPVFILSPLLKQLETMIPEDSPLEIILQAQPPRFALGYTVRHALLETPHGLGAMLTLKSDVKI